jgi:hypothetical protein
MEFHFAWFPTQVPNGAARRLKSRKLANSCPNGINNLHASFWRVSMVIRPWLMSVRRNNWYTRRPLRSPIWSVRYGNRELIPQSQKLAEKAHPPEIPAGVPSALFEPRPDRPAEAATDWTECTDRRGPGSVFPADLFDRQRLRGRPNQIEHKAGGYRAAVVCQRTIQESFREVSDALIAYHQTREFREQLPLLTASAAELGLARGAFGGREAHQPVALHPRLAKRCQAFRECYQAATVKQSVPWLILTALGQERTYPCSPR